MGLKRNLRIIFDRSPSPGKRYRARGFGLGASWGVWDMKRGRYLKDREVAKLSVKDLDEAWVH